MHAISRIAARRRASRPPDPHPLRDARAVAATEENAKSDEATKPRPYLNANEGALTQQIPIDEPGTLDRRKERGATRPV